MNVTGNGVNLDARGATIGATISSNINATVGATTGTYGGSMGTGTIGIMNQQLVSEDYKVVPQTF